MAVKASGSITLAAVTDVSAVTPYYKAQTSTLSPPSKPTSVPPSGWSATQPAVDTSNTCYIVWLMEYSNGTWGYSDVSTFSEYEAAKAAQATASSALATAQSTEQHFWFTGTGEDTGVHITEVTKQEFLNDPNNGGGNLLARSNGISARNGMNDLARFGTDGIFLYNEDEYPLFRVETGSARTSSFCSDGPFYDEEEVETTGKISTEPIAGSAITVILESAYSFTFTYGTASSDSSEHVHGEYQIKHTVTYDGEMTFKAYAQTRSTPAEAYGDPYAVRIITIFYYANTFQPLYTVGSSVGDRGGFSNTFGEGLKAEAKWQFVVGSFNDNIVDDVFEVGVGSDDDNRKTMFAVSGDGMYGGDVYESAVGVSGKNAGFMAHRTDTGRKVFLCVSTDGQSIGVWDTNKSNWIIRHDGNGNLYTNLGAVADQVIQQGTSGIWTYRKYASGIGECWGRWDKNNVASSTKWNNIYYGTIGQPTNYPFTFTAYPTVELTVQSSKGAGWGVFNNSDYSTSNAGTVYLATANSTTSTNVTVNIHALGRWK